MGLQYLASPGEAVGSPRYGFQMGFLRISEIWITVKIKGQWSCRSSAIFLRMWKNFPVFHALPPI
jgi:hypothetical protein